MSSLRSRLTGRLLLGGALLLGLAGGVLHWQVRRELGAEFNHSLQSTAQSLATMTEQKHGKARVEVAQENLPGFESRDGSKFFLLRTADGRELDRSISLGTRRLPLEAGPPGKPKFFDIKLPDGRMFRCAGVRFKPQEEDDEKKAGEDEISEAILVVGRDRAPIEHALAALRTSLVLVGAGALALLVVLIECEVRRGLAPLEQLAQSVASVEAGSLGTRFPEKRLPAELKPITRRLNELLARLGSAFARERRFTATAAHELRTPLAELRAVAEVNLSTPASEAERMESWRDTLAATLRMESLAVRLLDLARAEDPARALRCVPVPVAEALRAAWEHCAARAAARGIGLEISVPPDLVLETDPVILGVILGNLCANAALHGDAGKLLHVDATVKDGAVTIQFRNAAGEMSEADLPYLFERFWRKDAARADAECHGLGLALAAESAGILGGKLTACFGQNRELLFTLSVPAPVCK